VCIFVFQLTIPPLTPYWGGDGGGGVGGGLFLFFFCFCFGVVYFFFLFIFCFFFFFFLACCVVLLLGGVVSFFLFFPFAISCIGEALSYTLRERSCSDASVVDSKTSERLGTRAFRPAPRSNQNSVFNLNRRRSIFPERPQRVLAVER